jgi:hypothetical protein
MAVVEIRAFGRDMTHLGPYTIWMHLQDSSDPEGYRLLGKWVVESLEEWRRA